MDRIIIRSCLLAAFTLAASGALAQQMSEQQKDAIKSNCRSDYISNCMSVSPGGPEALQCLQRNLTKLSPGCKTVITATLPPPAAPAVAAPASPPPAPAAPPPAAAAAPPPAAAPPTPATAATPTAPVKRATAPAAPVRRATAAPAPARPAAPPPAAAAPPPAVAALPVRNYENVALPARLAVRRSCIADQNLHCSGVRAGGGRILGCLAAHQNALVPTCRAALAKALQ